MCMPLSILSVKYFRNICHYICISSHSFLLPLVNYMRSYYLLAASGSSYSTRQLDANEKENGQLYEKKMENEAAPLGVERA